MIDEERILEEFEEAWQSPAKPQLLEFVQQTGPNSLSLCSELIKIDMEYRWRRAPSSTDKTIELLPKGLSLVSWQPTHRDYEQALSDTLDFAAIKEELIVEEYRIRRRWGDDPTHENFLESIDVSSKELVARLQNIDQELEQRRSFIQRPKVRSPQLKTERLYLIDIHAGDRLDDFQILSEIGAGAFARVFLAQQISMQRFVALKISESKSDESPVLAQLDHPGIVRIFDERLISGLHLVYMQYVAGGNLRGVMNRLFHRQGTDFTSRDYLAAVSAQTSHDSNPSGYFFGDELPMDRVSTVAKIGSALCEALAHAHVRGVIHSDIKPENILIHPDGRPMLADFNLSFGNNKAAFQSVIRFGGTIGYMSPEQLRAICGTMDARCIGPTSDLYSLAIILYNMLTGESCFPEVDTNLSFAMTIEKQMASRINYTKRSDWNAEERMLGQAIERCLEADLSKRPTDAMWLYRRAELSHREPLRRLLFPKDDSFVVRCSSFPIAGLFAAGLVSSLIMSPLNIWANHSIATENFDRDFLKRIEEPVVNGVLYPLGLFIAWLSLLPVQRAVRGLQNNTLDEATRTAAATRCLQFPWLMFVVVFSIWTSSGLIFPLFNLVSSRSQIALMDIVGFFVSQILHGVVAACLALVLISWFALYVVYPRLICSDENPKERELLGLLDRFLVQGNSLLETVPLFALLAIAVSERLDKNVFFALALVGFVGYLAASNLVPSIRDAIRWYRLALGPTIDIKRHEWRSDDKSL